MENYFQARFTTGQFAQLMNISKETLFHYDKIGLFSPAFKGDNGYRYYLLDQVGIFYVISALKVLDTPLQEIKNFLEIRSPEDLVDFLEKKEVIFDKKINELQQLKLLIRERITQTKKALQIDTKPITVEVLAEEYLNITEINPIDNNTVDIYKSLSDYNEQLNDKDILSSYGGMIDSSKQFHHEFVYNCVFSKTIHYNKCNYIKPEGKYLIAYQNQAYTHLDAPIKQLRSFASANGYTIKGYFYVNVLLDDLSVHEYDNHLLQISVQVE